jgi:uracil-DNA glycosylase
MPLRIQDFINRYPALNEPPPQTRPVATTREDDGFFPVFSGRFNSRASQRLPSVLIVGQDWGKVETGEDQNSTREDLDASNFEYFRSWLDCSGLSLEQIFFTNMFLFVHTGNQPGQVYSEMRRRYPDYRFACLNVFRDTIRDLGSKVIVVCGWEAIDALISSRDIAPGFPRHCDLITELTAQVDEEPFYVGRIGGLQITLFVCYHWSTRNRQVIERNADNLCRLWRLIGQNARGGNA